MRWGGFHFLFWLPRGFEVLEGKLVTIGSNFTCLVSDLWNLLNAHVGQRFKPWLDIWKSWSVQKKKEKKKNGVSFIRANELFPSILELAFRFGVYQVHSVAHFIWAWNQLWKPRTYYLIQHDNINHYNSTILKERKISIHSIFIVDTIIKRTFSIHVSWFHADVIEHQRDIS